MRKLGVAAMAAMIFGVSSFGPHTPAQAGDAKVMAAQEALAKLGYDPGTPDGSWGGKSRKALNAFQKAHGLKPTRRLGKGPALALELAAAGAKSVPLPMADRVGNTLILDVGARVYYSPDGQKILRLPNGKVIKAKWKKKADGTYCEFVFAIKKMDCGDKFEKRFVIFKLDDKWTYFEKNGKKKWGMKLADGDQLKP